MKQKLDGALAQRLFDQVGSWPRVAAMLAASTGRQYKPQSLAVIAWKWRQVNGQATKRRRDRAESSLGILWRPALPKPLKVVPNYRTNTAAPA